MHSSPLSLLPKLLTLFIFFLVNNSEWGNQMSNFQWSALIAPKLKNVYCWSWEKNHFWHIKKTRTWKQKFRTHTSQLSNCQFGLQMLILFHMIRSHYSCFSYHSYWNFLCCRNIYWIITILQALCWSFIYLYYI